MFPKRSLRKISRTLASSLGCRRSGFWEFSKNSCAKWHPLRKDPIGVKWRSSLFVFVRRMYGCLTVLCSVGGRGVLGRRGIHLDGMEAKTRDFFGPET